MSGSSFCVSRVAVSNRTHCLECNTKETGQGKTMGEGGGGKREDKKGRGQVEGWKYGGKIWDGG